MKKSVVSAVGLFMLFFLAGAGLQAQNVIDQFLSKLKVGEWVEFEGFPQRDFTINVKEIEVVRGEMEDDDWELNGTVTRVVPEEKAIYMINLPIRFGPDTEYDEDNNIIKSFSDIKTGMFVEIEGQFTKDGHFMADEISTESVDDDERSEVQWTGKIDAIDLQNKTITMLGHILILIPDTKIKSFVH